MAQTKPDDVSQEDLDRQAKAMRDGLRKEAAAWSAAHSNANERSADDLGTARPPRRATQSVRRSPPPAPAVQAKPAPKSHKPFQMSYDGVTTAEHIATMIARGAR
jgi:hypothetical protein